MVVRKFGYPMVWLKIHSTFWNGVYKINDILYFIAIVYLLGCWIASSFTEDMKFEASALSVEMILHLQLAVLVTFYFLIYQKDINDLISKMDELTADIISSPLGHQDTFTDNMSRHCKSITAFVRALLSIVAINTCFFILPVCLTDYKNGRYGTTIPMPMSTGFSADKPFKYELTLLLQVLTLLVPSNKKAANDCLFLTFFRVQLVYARHLTLTIKELGLKVTDNRSQIHTKLVSWIKLHQKVYSITRKMVNIYTPIIVMYYVNLICMLTNLMLVTKSDNFDIVAGISTFIWVGVNILLLFLQSVAASDLAEQSEKTAIEAYGMPHYDLDKKTADLLRLVIFIANKPIQITAFRAPIFEMNKESFLQFSASVISTLMAFSKLYGM